MKLKFNACPKCRGDLQLRRDIYGMFVSCLQCGLQRDLDAPLPAASPARPTTAVPAAREAITGPGPGVSEGLLQAA